MLPLGSMFFFIASKTPLLHQLIQLHSLPELQTLRINMTSTINKNHSNSKQNKKATI